MANPIAFRVTNPAIMALTPVVELLHKCFTEMFPPGLAESLMETAVKSCVNPTQGVFLGAEEDKVLSFALVTLPRDAFDPAPVVRFFHNYGSNALKRAMILQVVDFVRQNGYTSFHALNTSGRPDSLWARTFRTAGVAEPLAGLVRFRIEDKTPNVQSSRRIRGLRKQPGKRDDGGPRQAAGNGN